MSSIDILTRASATRRLLPPWARALARSPAVFVSTLILSTVLLCAVLAPVLAPHDPSHQDLQPRLVPPMWAPEGTAHHILGTDALGRDLLSRIIYGSRISLIVGFAAVAVQGTMGGVLGLLSGYLGGRIDAMIMRIADIQLA